ncbi:hypothetical protein NKG94_35915 [Micromonospora sp. M12]
MVGAAGHPVPQFLEKLLTISSRLGPVLADGAILGQPVHPDEVAARLVARLVAGPLGGIEEFGGPEVLRLDEAARAWLKARGSRRPAAGAGPRPTRSRVARRWPGHRGAARASAPSPTTSPTRTGNRAEMRATTVHVRLTVTPCSLSSPR